jgi:hypothetical protein
MAWTVAYGSRYGSSGRQRVWSAGVPCTTTSGGPWPLVQEAISVPSRDTTRVMVASPAPLTWIVLFPVFMAFPPRPPRLVEVQVFGSWAPPGAWTWQASGLRPGERIGRPTYSLPWPQGMRADMLAVPSRGEEGMLGEPRYPPS